ncbi:MAG: DUF1573 domain-containing protein [Planctomycetota bacterium]|nr:DUF1573 domain-containing protein [Planctomycetota bacterium]
MKLFTIVFVAVLAGLGIGYAATIAEFGISTPEVELSGLKRSSGPSPRFWIEDPVHNFGTMLQKEKSEHTFEIKNLGKGVLNIRAGKPSCACTVGHISRTEIPPGESAKIHIEWITKLTNGPFSHGVPIHTNDPETSWIRLEIRGTVFPDYQFSPEILFVRTLSPNEPSTHRTKLHFFRHADVQIEGHQFSNDELQDFFEVQYEAIAKEDLLDHAKCGYGITIRVKAGMPLGPLRQQIVFTPSVKVPTALRLIMTGDITPDVKIRGTGVSWDQMTGTLDLGTIKKGTSRKSSLVSVQMHGKHRDSVILKLKEVVPPVLKVTIGESSRHANALVRRAPLEIEVPDSADVMSYLGEGDVAMGSVVIETTHPLYPEVTVNVKFAVVE